DVEHSPGVYRPVRPRFSAVSHARARVDAFAREELALQVETSLSPAPPAAAIAAQRPVAGDDPVARDDEPDGAAPDGTPDGAGRAGFADHPGDLAVARRGARRDAPNRTEDETVPCRSIVEVDGQVVQGGQVARGEGIQSPSRSIEMLSSWVPG